MLSQMQVKKPFAVNHSWFGFVKQNGKLEKAGIGDATRVNQWFMWWYVHAYDVRMICNESLPVTIQ